MNIWSRFRRHKSSHSGLSGRLSESGNVFLMLFGAVAMVGVLGASTMTLMKGPVKTMSQVTKRTLAENNAITTAKIAAVTSAQDATLDCDTDTWNEPYGYGTAIIGTGGGTIPAEIGVTRTDPWGNDYLYCSWNHGADNSSPCVGHLSNPGNANILQGGNVTSEYVMAVISAGPDGMFETTCNDYADVAPADGMPDVPLIDKIAGADDVVFAQTYQDAVDIAGGLWVEDTVTGDATIGQNLSVRDGATETFGFDATARTLTIGDSGVGTGQFPNINVDIIDSYNTGGIDFLDAIDVDGAITTNNNITATGNISGADLIAGGNLNVTGTSTLAGVNAGATTVSTLGASGAVNFSSTLGVLGTSNLADLNAQNTDVTTLDATGAVDFDSTLNVDGIADFNSTANFDSTVNLGDDPGDLINVNGTLILTDLNVPGNTTLGTNAANSLTINATVGSFLMGGNIDINGNRVTNVPDVPTALTDAVNANFVNTAIGGVTENDPAVADSLTNNALCIADSGTTLDCALLGGALDEVVTWNGTQWVSDDVTSLFTETDPQVDIINNAGDFCVTDGTNIDCNLDPATLTANTASRVTDGDNDTYLDPETLATDDDIIRIVTDGTERIRVMNTGEVLIGTSTNDASAIVNIETTTQGLLPPRMTEAQRDLIANPATGLVIYNTDRFGAGNGIFQFNYGTPGVPNWQDIGFGAAGSGLWTDNTTHITRENFHVINSGETSTTAGLDGDGTYSFYDPDSGAFRGGEIFGGDDAWQAANIGANSFAWGRNAEASNAFSSVSGGSGNTASGFASAISGGGSNIASNSYAFVGAGFGNNASGAVSSILGGDNNTVSGNQSAVVGGQNNEVSGFNSLSFGRDIRVGTGVAQTTDASAAEGNYSVGFGLGDASTATFPQVTGNETFAIFFGDQQGEDITATNVLALEGGSLLLSNDSGTACSAAKQGALRLAASGDALEICDFAGPANDWRAFTADAGDFVDRIQDDDNNTFIDVDTTDDGLTDVIVFENNGAESMRIDALGNVGIGINTPAHPLHIAGDAAEIIFQSNNNTITYGGASLGLVRNRSGGIVNDGDQLGSLRFFGDDGVDNEHAASIMARVDGAPGSDDMPARMEFHVAQDGGTVVQTTDTPEMVIRSSGSVGIGTGAPDASALLDVTTTTAGILGPRMTTLQKNAIVNPATGLYVFDTDTGIYEYNAGTPGAPNWQPLTPAGASVGDRIQDIDVNTFIDVDTSNNGLDNTIVFTNNTAESARFTTDGDLVIGDTAASLTLMLDVAGQVGATEYCDQNGINCVAAGDLDGPFDWDQLVDVMELDATTTIDMDTNTADLNFDGGTLFIDDDGQVGIGTAAPDGSALLELNSTTAGLLLPRMTTIQRDGIGSPAEGLTIYNTTTLTTDYFDGLIWKSFATDAGSALELSDANGDTLVQVEEGVNDDTIRFDTDGNEVMTIDPLGAVNMTADLTVGTTLDVTGVTTLVDDLVVDTNTLFVDASGNNVGIGTAAPDASALLDITTTTAGILGPRLTTIQKNAIVTPATGLYVFDTDLNRYQYNAGTPGVPDWQNITPPGAGLWTDNTTHITRENLHIIDSGETSTTAGLDGNGVRAFYDPDTGSLRGGEITGSNDAWQAANIGINSFGWGQRTEASGAGAMAQGYRTTASGDYSFAGGINSIASANTSFTYGNNSTASAAYSIAMGQTATASTADAIAIGRLSNSSGTGSIAISNFSSTASGAYSSVLGRGLTASGFSSRAFGFEVQIGTGVAQISDATADVGNYSVGFGLGDASTATLPQITSNQTAAFFFGDQESSDVDEEDTLALVGGKLMIDQVDNGTDTDYGCIRYNDTSNELEFADDCDQAVPSWSAFSSGIADDSLDWAQFVDAMELDATTTIDMDTNAADLNFDSGTFLIDSDVNRIGIGTATTGLGTGIVNIGSPALGTPNINIVANGAAGTSRIMNITNIGTTRSADISIRNTSNVEWASIFFGNGNSGFDDRVAHTVGSTVMDLGTLFQDAVDSHALELSYTTNKATSGDDWGILINKTDTSSPGVSKLIEGQTGGVEQFWIGDQGNSYFAGNMGIGTQTPDASAILDVNTTTAGILGPRMTTANKNAIVNPATGLYVFDTTLNRYQYNAGTPGVPDWQNITPPGAGLWTDNATHITRENFHILDTGLAAGSTTAGLDGDGTYSFYDPDKGAMRGGVISGGNDAFEDTNVGLESFAWGENAQATGAHSFAAGEDVTALGNQATAFGEQVTASGVASFAVGDTAQASGNSSAAIGNSVIASNYGAIAMGTVTQATGDNAVALGRGGQATGDYSTVAGGNSNLATGANSFASGRTTTASGYAARSMGHEVRVGTGVAQTTDATADVGNYSMAFGLGNASTATVPQVTSNNTAAFFFSDQESSDVDEENTLALVGGKLMIDQVDNGTDTDYGCIRYNDTSNALEFANNCDAGSPTYNPLGGAAALWTDNTTHITRENFHILDGGLAAGSTTAGLDGDGTYVFFDPDKRAFRGGQITGGNDAFEDANIGANSFAWGLNAEANGANAFAIGDDTTVSAQNSFAGGQNSIASADQSFAFGDTATASNSSAVAMGRDTTASGQDSTALSYNTTASGDGSVSIGYLTVASGSDSLATGYTTTASGFASTSFGRDVIAGTGVAQGLPGTSDVGNYSVAFGLGDESGAGNIPQVTANQAFGVFFGDQSDSTVTDENVLALVGGQLLIDAVDGGTDTEYGCIRYNDTSNELEYANDCDQGSPSYVSFSAPGVLAINDLTDAYTDYATDNNLFMGQNAGNNPIAGSEFNLAIGENSFTGVKTATASNNLAVGQSTLRDLTEGFGNVALGYEALRRETTGDMNTAVGWRAMQEFVDGRANVAVGHDTLAGQSGLSDGDFNTAIGFQAGEDLTTGDNNTLMGHEAGWNLTTGNANILIGTGDSSNDDGGIGNTLTTGSNNILIGASTVDVPTNATDDYLNIGDLIYGDLANNEIFLPGPNAEPVDGDFLNSQWTLWLDEASDQFELKGRKSDGTYISQTVGVPASIFIDDLGDGYTDYGVNDNFFLGHEGGAGLSADNTNNTGIGINALDSLTTVVSGFEGEENVAVGQNAMTNATRAWENVAIGFDAMRDITIGYNNVAVGYQALSSSTINFQNTAIGHNALQNSDGGNDNTAVGKSAMQEATTARNSTAIGLNALEENQTGFDNVAIGSDAASGVAASSDVSRITVIGQEAASNILTGANDNTIMGDEAAINLTTGAANLILGTGIVGNNVGIGDTLTTGSNNILIGDGTVDVPAAGTDDYMNIANLIYSDMSIGSLLVGENTFETFSNSSPLYQFYADSAQSDLAFGTATSTTPTSKADIDLFRARGSIGSEAAVTVGDQLGALRFSGHDGTDFETKAEIVAEVDNTVANNTVPTALLFRTIPDTSDIASTERMRIGSDGNIGMGDFSGDTIESALHLVAGEMRFDGGAGNEAGCIRFDDTADELQWSDDCSSFNSFGGGGPATAGGSDTHVQYNSGGVLAGEAAFVYDAASDTLTLTGTVEADTRVTFGQITGAAAPNYNTPTSLWTDNTTHITRESFHVIDSGSNSTTAGLDGNGFRAFFDSDKGAFRSGGITGGNAAWQDANIGDYSMASGSNARASAWNSHAFGHITIASGTSAFAGGEGSVAAGGNTAALGSYAEAHGLYSYAFGRDPEAWGYGSMAFGHQVQVGTGVAQTTDATADVGNYSIGFGLGDPSTATFPQVTSNQTAAFFFGDQESSDVDEENTLALVGGKLMIDAVDNGTDTDYGCIRYNDTSNQLEFAHDCDQGSPTYTALGGGGGAINDLSDGSTDYVTDFNLFMGSGAGASIVAGAQNNLAIGQNAFNAYTGTGDYNTFVGYEAATNLTSGGSNVGLGSGVMAGRTGGGNNIAIGYNALRFQDAGDRNVAIGTLAGANPIGSNMNDNTYVGDGAGFGTPNSINILRNTAIGSGAGENFDTGAENNTLLGYYSGNAMTTGANNTFLGYQTGDATTTGSDNIIIGYDIDASSATASNELNIGDTIYGDLSTDSVGIGIVSPASALHVSGDVQVTNFVKFDGVAGNAPTYRTPALALDDLTDVSAASPSTNEVLTWNGTSWVASVPGAGSSLWTDNSSHITREAFHIIDSGSNSTAAGLDGNGTYIFADTDKGSIRGGEISGGNSDWQDGNIGINSFAWGLNTEAEGAQSFAVGSTTYARNSNAAAFGAGSQARASNAFAIGSATNISGNNSFGGGNGTIVSGDNSFGFGGTGVTASGDTSVALGGDNATASGDFSVAIGSSSTASGNGSFALGNSDATGGSSFSMGIRSVASGYRSFTFGFEADTGTGVAQTDGTNSNVGNYSMAFGLGNTTTTNPSVVANESAGFFFGDQDSSQVTEENVLGLVGGMLLIDAVHGGADTDYGCIRYNDTSNVLEFADDCDQGSPTWTSFSSGGASIAINDLTDAGTDYTTDFNFFMGDNAGAAILAGAQYNFAIGQNAGDSITSGDQNMAVGYEAGASITTGVRNMIMGRRSGNTINTGDENTIIGDASMEFGVDGGNNTTLGHATMFRTGGDNNTAIGRGALSGTVLNTTINRSTALGMNAGANVIAGADNNIFVGYQAGDATTSGSDNIIIGYDIDASSATASNELNIGNLIYGDLANNEVFLDAPAAAPADGDLANGQITFWLDDAGDEIELKARDASGDIINSTIGGGGGGAINDLSDGSTDYVTDFNLFMGDNAGANQPAGAVNNTAIGINSFDDAGKTNTADNNVALGYNTLTVLTTGSGNTVMGSSAGSSITDAPGSVLIGNNAGSSITNSGDNTHVGAGAGENATGHSNTFIGSGSGQQNATGDNNVYMGRLAGGNGNNGNQNVYLGSNAGFSGAGSRNIYIGYDTGRDVTTGADNILIGYDVETSAVGASFELNIGDMIYGNLTNDSVAIGTTATATGDNSFAVGSNADATANYTFASGINTTASGLYSVAMGINSTASNVASVALGSSAVASGEDGFATGYLMTAAGYGSIAMGQKGFADGDYSMAVALGDASGGSSYPRVTSNRTAGFFFDNQFDSVVNDPDSFALVGGKLLIDDVHNGTDTDYGCIRYNDTSNALEWANNCDNVTPTWTAFGGGSTSDRIQDSDSDSYVDIDPSDDGTNDDMLVQLNGQEVMRVFGSGGANTLNTVNLRLENDSITSANRIHFRHDGGTNYGYLGYDGTDMYIDAIGTNAITFQDDGTERMRIDDGGNVGIGTAAPASELQVIGDIQVSNFVKFDGVAGNAPVYDTPSLALNDLSDTSVAAPTTNHVLTFNGTNWVAQASSGGGALDDLSDVLHDTTTDFDGGADDDDDNLFLGHEATTLTGAGSPGARNTSIGATAGDALTEGDENVLIGYDAGTALTTGNRSIMIGWRAGQLVTTPSSNILVGASAGRSLVSGGSNVIIGTNAGQNATNNSNTFIGSSAGGGVTTGADNVFIGDSAGASAGATSNTTAVGVDAGRNVEGNNNTFFGFQAGDSVTSGSGNILIGYDIDASAATASDELNIGDLIYGDLANGEVFLDAPAAAPVDGDLANGQVTFWVDATNDEIELKAKDSAGDVINVTVGGGGSINDLSDGATSYGGDNNIFMGQNAGGAVVAGAADNLGIGIDALDSGGMTSAADENVAIGNSTLTDITSGSSNTAVGHTAGRNTSSGSNNTFIGNEAGFDTDLGDHNTFIGDSAGEDTDAGSANTFIGSGAGQANVAKERNTAVGYFSQRYADPTGTGSFAHNTSIGYHALRGSTTAASNTGIENTALGARTLSETTSGSNNIGIGFESGDNITTGSDNIIIGHRVDAPSATADHQLRIDNAIFGDLANDYISIGTGAIPTQTLDVGTAATMRMLLNTDVDTADDPYNLDMASTTDDAERRFTLSTEEGTYRHALQFGDGVTLNNDTIFGIASSTDSGTTWAPTLVAKVDGNVGIGTNAPSAALDVAGDIEYSGVVTDVSDRRLKENIEALSSTMMLDRLMKVDGYTFQMIDRKDDDRVEYGVIAQEIESIFPELVHTDTTTEEAYKSVNYTGLITPIIEAVKELYSKVLEIMDQIKVIFDKIAQLESENAKLQAEVEMLKQQNNDILQRLDSLEANAANDNKVEASFEAESTLDIQASGI